jgi:hypothetical protein
MDRIEGNGIRTVIVEDASRFARELVTQELGILALIKRGVRVLTASGDDLTDSSDPSHKMMRQIAGSFAEYEKARLVATVFQKAIQEFQSTPPRRGRPGDACAFGSAFGRDIDGLAAGIKIGLRVREMDWATSVTNECASVCGMIWLAGTILLAAKRGRAEQRLPSVDQSTHRRCEVLQRDYPGR